MTKNQFTIQPGNALPLGVTKVADGVQFAIYLPDKRECYLKLFRKGHQTEQYRICLLYTSIKCILKGFDKIAKDHYSITSNILPRNVGNVKISCVANL